MRHTNVSLTLLAGLLVAFTAGCKKTPPVTPASPPPPPVAKEAPPPPARPAINSFTVEPSSIQRGQSATLRWSVGNADSVMIDQGIGTVAASGSRQIYPNDSTTYTLTAKGPGGESTRPVRLTVTEPPAPPPAPKAAPEPTLSVTELLQRDVQDVYFDLDQYDIREDARSMLTRNADALKSIFSKHPGGRVVVEGHCDERGSPDYNLGLGDRRASSVRDFLLQLGVPSGQVDKISYGKERPQCTDANEDCWQRNRRAHFSSGQ